MQIVEIIRPNSETSTPIKAPYCSSFITQFKGLMFHKELEPNEGLLLVESNDSIINSSIHMFFMLFDIAVIWINSDNIIVDKVLAKKWYPFYFPNKPARYILECHPSQFEQFQIDDRLIIRNV